MAGFGQRLFGGAAQPADLPARWPVGPELPEHAGRGRNLLARAMDILPHGRELTQEDWNRRHRAIVVLLWLHVVGLAAFAWYRGFSGLHVLADGGAVAAFAVLATQPNGGRKLRATFASIGLLTASALLVHLSGGFIEAHFHFFVVIAILMLYQDWLPFLVAIGYVVIHHGLIGTLYPSSVYNTAAAQANPWLWACIHGAFVLAASAANLAYWRISESDHDKAVRAQYRAARLDGLTGAVNRRGWDEEVPRTLALARRTGIPVSVALLDFDSFKDFNDSWGHQKGDELLAQSVRAWRATLRQEDVLARYGGDEFGVVLFGSDLESAQKVLERMRMVTPDGQTCSIGVAMWDGNETATQLIARIDSALYTGKKHKRGPDRRIHVAGQDAAGPDHAWAERLPGIIEHRSIESVYQPVLQLKGRTIYAFEALARPTDGAEVDEVDEMFRAAKRLGYLRNLDWICRRAALEGGNRMARTLPLFVNVSLSSLMDPVHDVDQMMLLCEWASRKPKDIILEINEQEEGRDLRRLGEVIDAYRRKGFRLALDDVGEGHSTLELLVSANPEYIKIARSLTSAVGSKAARSAIQAIVNFAGAMGGQVVAEGIEDDEALATMVELGVGLGQGFHLGMPGRQAKDQKPAVAAVARANRRRTMLGMEPS